MTMTVDSADTVTMETPSVHERIDNIVEQAEELLRLTTGGRTLFTEREVMDVMLDVRNTLVAVRELLPVPA